MFLHLVCRIAEIPENQPYGVYSKDSGRM